jgi:hypothetical protein
MCKLQNTTRSDSHIESSGEDRDLTKAFTGKVYNKDLIKKVDTIPIVNIFKNYGLRLNEYNIKSICPIPTHKGGRESTASFYYYAHTNTFYCFGCQKGGGCCDFVSAMDKITKISAAYKILELFGDDVSDEDFPQENFVERFEMMRNFSDTVREFHQEHFDKNAFDFIEKICWIYDSLTAKHKEHLTNEALNKVVNDLVLQIKSYL